MDASVIRLFAERRERARRGRAAERKARLLAAVPRLAGILMRELGASRVLLFGSLAWGVVDEHSDIDLAAEGVEAGRYFEAIGRLLEEAPCAVDLVRLEDAPEALRLRILRDGLGVDERG